MSAQRALFLSGSLGKGHDTLAEACAEALAPIGVESRIVDSMPMLGRGPGRVGNAVFRAMLSIPPVYDAYHFSQLRSPGRFGAFSDRAAIRVMLPHLRAEMSAFDPDLVVSVFATGAAGAASLKHEYPDVLTVVFMTDSFAHRIWAHEGTDLFLVTSELAAASIRRYVPSARIEVIEAPVRREFVDTPSRDEARISLGIDPDARCALVISGGWGIGPIVEIAEALSGAGCTVLAVAGSNARTEARLRELAERQPDVVPFGYTDRLAELMAAADVVVTSSGDTCREARWVGRPLVLLDVVPGHGRENLMHELEMGDAAVAEPEPAAVVGVVDRMLSVTAGAGPPRPAHREWADEFLGALRRAGADLGPAPT